MSSSGVQLHAIHPTYSILHWTALQFLEKRKGQEGCWEAGAPLSAAWWTKKCLVGVQENSGGGEGDSWGFQIFPHRFCCFMTIPNASWGFLTPPDNSFIGFCTRLPQQVQCNSVPNWVGWVNGVTCSSHGSCTSLLDMDCFIYNASLSLVSKP